MDHKSILAISLLFMGLVAAQELHSPRHPFAGSEIDPSIILGDPAEQGEIPFQAFLVSSRNNSNSGALCGGSLIRPNWVLTAAHCVVNTDRTQVGLGSVNRNNMTYSELSYQRFPHERYNPLTITNDVALIKLPVNASGDNISTIEIAPTDIGALDGKYRVVRSVLRSSIYSLNLCRIPGSSFGLRKNDGRRTVIGDIK